MADDDVYMDGWIDAGWMYDDVYIDGPPEAQNFQDFDVWMKFL